MTTPRTPVVGERVLCDGEYAEIKELATRFASTTGERIHALYYANERLRHYGLVRDLIWCEHLGAWYLWGRVLSHDQSRIVADLRDRGRLAARPSRRIGDVPAAGEHHQLYLALFHRQDHEFWPAEMTRVVRGQPFSAPAQAAADDLAERFTHKLEHGYADRDADDSHDEPGAV
jgi:hypothetical protein